MRDKKGEVGLGSLVAIIGVVVFLLLIPTAMTILGNTTQTLPGGQNTSEFGASYIIFQNGIGFTCAKNGTNGVVDYSGSDATHVIQDVLTRIDGGTLAFRGGEYEITSTINLTSGIKILGEGASTPYANPVQFVADLDGIMFDATSVTGIIFEDVSFVSDVSHDAIAISLTGSNTITLKRVYAELFSSVLYANQSGGIRIENSNFYFNGETSSSTGAVVFNDDGGLQTTSVVISSCVFQGNYYNDIQVIGGLTGLSITDSWFELANPPGSTLEPRNAHINMDSGSNTVYSVRISRNTFLSMSASSVNAEITGCFMVGSTISDNYLQHAVLNPNAVINITSFDYSAMTGNMFNGLGVNSGVYSAGGYSHFDHNTFLGGGAAALSLTTVSGCTVSSNSFKTGTIGLWLHITGNPGLIISDNTFDSLAVGIQMDSNTGYTTITNNYFSTGVVVPFDCIGGLASTNRVYGNLGYITERYGTAVIESTNSSVEVTHGLADVPTKIIVTGSTVDTATLYVDTIGISTFTIHASGAVGGDRTIYWYAEV